MLPRCLGGSDDVDNIVILTAREHFIAHQLLVKVYPGHRGVIFALHMMTVSPNGNGERLNNRTYEWIRIRCAGVVSGSGNPMYGVRRMGAENHFYGRHHNERTKALLRERCANWGDDNGFYGKNHSDVTKQILREQRSLGITVVMEVGSRSFASIKSFSEWFAQEKGVSVSLGAKLCKPQHQNLLSKYGIQEVIKHYEDHQH